MLTINVNKNNKWRSKPVLARNARTGQEQDQTQISKNKIKTRIDTLILVLFLRLFSANSNSNKTQARIFSPPSSLFPAPRAYN